MKKVYPIVLIKTADDIVVYIPDFNINTEGKDYSEAIFMARDAIGLLGIELEDQGKTLPEPSEISNVKKENEGDIVTLVDIDFAEYRRKMIWKR